MTQYSKEQQIHSLSLASNAASDVKDQTSLQTFVTSVISNILTQNICTDYIGTDWKTVWGPVVHLPDSTSHNAANTMVLFYSPGQNLLVLAIAATNADSKFDWILEDFNILPAPWSSVMGYKVQPDFNISQGTATGIGILKQMQSQGNTLVQSLTNFTSTLPANAELAVAGHSLGGALSPTMALYLHDTKNVWNKNNNVTTISAWPTAGPTPGGEAFAAYFKNAGISYTSKYNSLDVVPLAWDPTTFGTIATLYEPNITPSSSLQNKLAAITAALKVSKIDYKQMLPWTEMTGTFCDNVVKQQSSPTPASPDPDKEFKMEAGYQHTTAYNELLEITEFASGFSQIRAQLGEPFNPLICQDSTQNNEAKALKEKKSATA